MNRFLPELELYVLLAAARLGDDAYGVTIRAEIQQRAGRSISVGALYTTLARLEAKGMVRFRVSDPLPQRGGRPRKYVQLTAAGLRALRGSAAGMQRMIEGLDLLPE